MLIPVHQSPSPIVQHYSSCFSATPWIIDIFLSSLPALGASWDDCCSLFNILYTLALFHHSPRSPTVNSVLLFGAHDNKEWWKSSGGHCCLLFVFYFACLCFILQRCVGAASMRGAAGRWSTHHTTLLIFSHLWKTLFPLIIFMYMKSNIYSLFVTHSIWCTIFESDWVKANKWIKHQCVHSHQRRDELCEI